MNARRSDAVLERNQEAGGNGVNGEEFFDGFTESRLDVGLCGTIPLSADTIDGGRILLFLIGGEDYFAVSEDAAGGLEITDVWKRGYGTSLKTLGHEHCGV